VEQLARYRPLVLRGEATGLATAEQEVLRRLIQAGEFLDRAYWEQASPGAWPLRQTLAASGRPQDAMILKLLLLNAGPFDRLLSWEPFAGESLRPPGGGFYPEFATREELERRHDPASGAGADLLAATTVVRREAAVLVATPFHVAYREWVEPAAALVREAASLAGDLSRVSAISGLAEALATDEYAAAEAELLGLPPEGLVFALGPGGATEDRLLGVKRSYGALIGRVDAAASEPFAAYAAQAPALEALLSAPGAVEARPPLTIVAIRDLYRGGAFACGFQEGSLLLPLDPRAAPGVGARLLISPGLIAARVEHLILPVAPAVAELQRSEVTAESATAIAIMHALGHALGPRLVGPPEAPVPIGDALRDDAAWVDEARAEATGLWGIHRLREQGTLPAGGERGDATSALAGLLAAARLGDAEPAGLAATVALNWHRERRGVTFDRASKTWAADLDRIQESAGALARELHEIQATGDRAAAARMRQTYGRPDPDLRATLRRLAPLPVALAPSITIAWK